MGVFFAPTPKPSIGYTNVDWAERFQAIAKYRSQKMKKNLACSGMLTRTWKLGGCTGIVKKTKVSAVYPRLFCKVIVHLQFDVGLET